MSGELVVTGQAEVAAGFAELERSLDDLSEVNRRVLGPLIPEVRARTPIRTGALAMSWSLATDKESGSIESGLRYAGPIEFGVPSRGIEAQRMVRDTIESNERAIVQGYEDAIADRARAAGFEVDR